MGTRRRDGSGEDGWERTRFKYYHYTGNDNRDSNDNPRIAHLPLIHWFQNFAYMLRYMSSMIFWSFIFIEQLNVEKVEYEDPFWVSWNKYEPRVSSYRGAYIREKLRVIILILEMSMIFFRSVWSVSYRDSWKDVFWAWQMGYSVMLSSRPDSDGSCRLGTLPQVNS